MGVHTRQAHSPGLETREISLPPPAGRGLLQWQDKVTPAAAPLVDWRVHEEFMAPTCPNPDTHHAANGAYADSTLANRLYYGDNREALAHLLADGWEAKIRLVYIDPPFDSGLAYARKLRTRGPNSRTVGQAVQYRDVWDADTYLQFMHERLLLLRPLLAPDGVIWLHCDYRQAHRLQLLLEEVFGAENYLNTIAWRSQVARGAKVNAFYFPNSTHYLHIFAKDRAAPPVWCPPRKRLVFTRRQAAAQFMEDERGFFRTSDPGTYSFERLKELHAAGRLYAPYDGEICIDEANRQVYCSNGGNIGVKYYLTQEGKNRFSVERAVDNLWDDIPGLGTTPGEDRGYPTQKTAALLERILATSTRPGDWVLDCFAGSGTTLAVAQQMRRRWIGGDVGYGAIQTIRRRLAVCTQSTAETPGFVLYRRHASACPSPDSSACTPHAVAARQDGHVRVRLDEVAPGIPRHMIDSVEIDPGYDGRVFRPRHIDAPHSQRELVAPHYDLTHADPGASIALRITQVTGEEEMILIRVENRG